MLNRVLTAVEDAEHAIKDLQGLQRGSLRIGASTTPGMYIIPRTIAQFKQRYPQIDVQLGIRDTREIEAGSSEMSLISVLSVDIWQVMRLTCCPG